MTQRTRVSLEPAWILHHYPYRDSSLLLEVFTNEGNGTLVVGNIDTLSPEEQSFGATS